MHTEHDVKINGGGDSADVLDRIRTMTPAQREDLVQLLLEKYGMEFMRLLLLPQPPV